jgi:hypothetical protein
MKRLFLYQILSAPQDKNGNPRRVTLQYNRNDGQVVGVRDDAYTGAGIPIGAIELPRMEVTATEYRNWVKLGESRGLPCIFNHA